MQKLKPEVKKLMRMNPEVKDKWVDALSSGEFVKGQGALCRPTETEALEHCCLGVLSEVYRRETGKGKWVLSTDETCFRFTGEHDSSGGFLIAEVYQWAGLNDPNPDVEGDTLSSMNDQGVSFENIARIIKNEL